MLGFILAIAIGPFLATSHCEAVQCYHCYDSFNKPLSLENLGGENFDNKLVRCDKNKNKWNSVVCPVQWPICTIVSGTVGDHYEIVRSCAQRDFCSKYTPPPGVKMDYCQECNTTLCNDYKKAPDDPPVKPEPDGPLLTFNINIDLSLKKIPNSGDTK